MTDAGVPLTAASFSARPGAGRQVAYRRPLVYRICHAIARVSSSVLVDLKTFGVENVPTSGGVLLVCNHGSYLDPMVNSVLLPRPMSYLAQSGLFKNPVFGWIIRQCGAFPVQQGKGDVGAVKETIRHLKEGRMLNIFPEGSRTLTGKPQAVQPGVALVIKRAHVPVVPCVISGAWASWPPGQLMPRRGQVRVLYGPPLKMDHLDARAIVREVDRLFEEMLSRLDKISKAYDCGEYRT